MSAPDRLPAKPAHAQLRWLLLECVRLLCHSSLALPAAGRQSTWRAYSTMQEACLLAKGAVVDGQGRCRHLSSSQPRQGCDWVMASTGAVQHDRSDALQPHGGVMSAVRTWGDVQAARPLSDAGVLIPPDFRPAVQHHRGALVRLPKLVRVGAHAGHPAHRRVLRDSVLPGCPSHKASTCDPRQPFPGRRSAVSQSGHVQVVGDPAQQICMTFTG